MKLVVIESPYAGDVKRNVRYLRAAMADCLARGEAPYASHGLYTQPGVLRDDVPDERARGIRAGLAWGDRGDVRTVYGDLGVTPGMLLGVERADKRGQPVEHRRIPGWDQPFVTNPDPGSLAIPLSVVDADVARVRAALDVALNESYRDSRNSHTWAGTSDCASHNEGLACCLDPNHDRYGAMLDELAGRVADLLRNGHPAPRTPAPPPVAIDDDTSDPEFDSDPDDGGD